MMETKALPGVLIMLLISAISSTIFFPLVEADFAIIVVPEDYVTIQQAVDSAHPGSKIYVKNGTYCEDLILNKPNLTLLCINFKFLASILIRPTVGDTNTIVFKY